MAGGELFLATLPCKLRAPDLFLTLLLGDELLERCRIDVPEARDARACNETGTGEGGDVIRSKLHHPRRFARADVGDAVDNQCLRGHEGAKPLLNLQSVRKVIVPAVLLATRK